MKKKVLIGITLGLLVSLIGLGLISGIAYAKDAAVVRRPHRAKVVLGQVKEVSDTQIKIRTLKEKDLTFSLNEDTVIKDTEGNDLTVDDLALERWVNIAFAKNDGDLLIAKRILLMKEGFDPSNYERLVGLVTKINQSSESFSLKTRKGEELSVAVNEQTRYFGAAGDFNDVKEGMLAEIIAEKSGTGDYLANILRFRYPVIRLAGSIKQVDSASGEFVLLTRRDNKEVTVMVSEKTRFKSRDDTITGIDDLKPDMVAFVLAKKEKLEEGSPNKLEAILVAAGNREQLPQFALKTRGKITAISSDSLTVENPSGESFDIKVSDETQIRSRGDVVTSFSDLKVGMHILVGGEEFEGVYLAKVIIVLPKRK